MEDFSRVPGSMTRLARQLHSEDPVSRELAAAGLWDRYAAELLRMARQSIAEGLRRREDEFDVVQDAFSSFCARQQRGEFTVHNRNDLWRLLVSITLCKARNIAQRHQAARRDFRREESPASHEGLLQPARAWVYERIKSSTPTPEEAAIFQEQFCRVLSAIPEDLRTIALWKFEGFSHTEIAHKLNRTERTVSRKLELIRVHLLEYAGLEDA